jgi:hypothetical protein
MELPLEITPIKTKYNLTRQRIQIKNNTLWEKYDENENAPNKMWA